eukprot:762125-Hanusia_phi.AAC.2
MQSSLLLRLWSGQVQPGLAHWFLPEPIRMAELYQSKVPWLLQCKHRPFQSSHRYGDNYGRNLQQHRSQGDNNHFFDVQSPVRRNLESPENEHWNLSKIASFSYRSHNLSHQCQSKNIAHCRNSLAS